MSGTMAESWNTGVLKAHARRYAALVTGNAGS
jgi:hypothetical protein